MTKLPPLPEYDEIQVRLERVFPEGLTDRTYLTRPSSASTVFVMLYLGALEDTDYWIKPDQVVRMSDEQASRTSSEERLAWREESVRRGGVGAWYAKNTRESIRDETLRHGLLRYGAAVELHDVPTTSSRGRYALKKGFAQLFDPALRGEELEQAIKAWQERNLSASAQARVQLVRGATVQTGRGVLVRFPNDETRRLAPGPSSEITKSVVESFAPRFLRNPGVLWISESGQRESYRDAELLRLLGITLQTDRLLPDIILVDLGEEERGDSPVFVFVEVVASDGPINEERREALLYLITEAGYGQQQARFVTAYRDRNAAPFKQTFSSLAWDSFAWCLSEPTSIIGLHHLTEGQYLADLP